jgi:ankyrin repeat protein
LHVAIDSENAVAARRILGHGADPTILNENGQTPVHIAAQKGGAIHDLFQEMGLTPDAEGEVHFDTDNFIVRMRDMLKEIKPDENIRGYVRTLSRLPGEGTLVEMVLQESCNTLGKKEACAPSLEAYLRDMTPAQAAAAFVQVQDALPGPEQTIPPPLPGVTPESRAFSGM